MTNPRRAEGKSQKRFPTPRRDHCLHPRQFRPRPSARARSRAPSDLKNADRIELKRMLREPRRRRRHRQTRPQGASAPAPCPLVMADITGRDRDGELIAVADRMGRGPTARRRKSASDRRAERTPAPGAGVGDRVLLRLADERRSPRSDPPLPAASSRCWTMRASRARRLPRHARRRRAAGAGRQEAARPRHARSTRPTPMAPRTAISIAVELLRGRGRPAVGRASRNGSVRCNASSAVSLIAIHAHDIPHVFPDPTLRGGRGRAGRRRWRAARTGATCRCSPSTRPMPRITTMRCMPSPTPIRPIAAASSSHVAIADVVLLCPAGLGARPRGADARQLGLFPRPRGADAARAHLQRSSARCDPASSRGALAVRIVIAPTAASAAHTASIAC